VLSVTQSAKLPSTHRHAMGRRAKNKQGAPEPLVDAPHPSAKKLGKRKAEVEGDATSKRPAKKLKDEGKKGSERHDAAKEEGKKKTKTKPSVSSKAAARKKEQSSEEESADESAEGVSSAGWEDVDDIKAEAKYVYLNRMTLD
jgi:25S rRNA (cytosine2870-C5)-methyltransferase